MIGPIVSVEIGRSTRQGPAEEAPGRSVVKGGDLPPCPFCGRQGVLIPADPRGSGWAHVECYGCGARAPLTAWERRTDPTPTEGGCDG